MKKLLYSLPLLLALSACSSEEVTAPEVNQPAGTDGYYLTLNLNVPSDLLSSRAGETLDGVATEEAIEYLDLYLVDATSYEVLWSKTEITSLSEAAVNNTYDKSYKLELDVKGDLVNLHNLFGHNISVVAVCNLYGKYTAFNATTSKLIDGKFPNADFIGDYLNSGIEGKTMPMASDVASSAISTFSSPSSATTPEAKKAAVSDKFTTETSGTTLKRVLNLGNITVERGVARLDVKDAEAGTGSTKVAGEDWTYKIGKSDVKIKMYSIYPFNINNTDSYIIRHRAQGDANKATAAANLFSASATEWVVDGSWTFGTGEYTKGTTFTNPYSNAETAAGTLISDLVKTDAGFKRTLANGYYPWWYVTENTMPSTDVMTLKNVTNDGEDLTKYATGVCFKFQIMGTNAQGQPEALTTSNKSSLTLPAEIYVPESGDDIYIVMSETDKYMKVTPENGNYMLNYYGFITHDKNSENLEYGVVRNNAYQMSVKTIDKLPKEDGDVIYYLELTINVLKWIPNQVDFEF